jgi:hypothetical protein
MEPTLLTVRAIMSPRRAAHFERWASRDTLLPRHEMTRTIAKPKMKIDIDRLTEAELVDLNNRIVERLRFLHQMRSHAEMLEFRIGDRVEFQPEGQPLVVGMLTRYNKKSVTVITDTGQRWNVAPRFLRGVSEKPGDTVREPNVIQLRKR